MVWTNKTAGKTATLSQGVTETPRIKLKRYLVKFGINSVEVNSKNKAAALKFANREQKKLTTVFVITDEGKLEEVTA